MRESAPFRTPRPYKIGRTVGPGVPDRAPAAAVFPPPGSGRWGLTPLAARILLAGLLLREAFSFWTGHPYDFENWVRTGHAVAVGANPYAYWPSVPGVSFAYLGQELPSAAYLPFWPLLLGGLYRLWELVGFQNRFVLYFLLKQPPILADVLVAYLLYRLAGRWSGRVGPALEALGAWSFFPYAILISAVWGQFDSIVLALLLGVFFVQEPLARNVLYGFGIFVKFVTAIYLPLEAFVARGWRRLGVVVAVVIPIALTFAIFAGLGWGTTNLIAASVSQTHGSGGGMNWVGIVTAGPINPYTVSVPGLDLVLSYLWVPAVVVAGVVAARWATPGDARSLLRPLILVTAVFLLFRFGLYEQYLVYLFALLALDLAVAGAGRREIFQVLSVSAYVYLVLNNDFLLRFLSPLNTSISPDLISLDASLIYGTFRTWALIVLCGVVTIALVQVVYVYFRDVGRPRSWLLGGRTPAPAAPIE